MPPYEPGETTRVGAGGLLVRGNEMLLAKRSPERRFYPGVWDVVGGHSKGDEVPADTLVREVEEEIGVTPRAFEEIAVLSEPQPSKHGKGRYHIFLVTDWGDGEPRLLGSEHSELRWIGLEQALRLPIAHPGYRDLFRAALDRAGERERDI